MITTQHDDIKSNYYKLSNKSRNSAEPKIANGHNQENICIS